MGRTKLLNKTVVIGVRRCGFDLSVAIVAKGTLIEVRLIGWGYVRMYIFNEMFKMPKWAGFL